MSWRNVPPIGLGYRAGSPAVPPAIRRASWTPPQIGIYFMRASDRSVWQVADVFRRDQQVKLVSDAGCDPLYPFAAELLRDFRQVAS